MSTTIEHVNLTPEQALILYCLGSKTVERNELWRRIQILIENDRECIFTEAEFQKVLYELYKLGALNQIDNCEYFTASTEGIAYLNTWFIAKLKVKI